jgi:MazG family protein
VNADEAVDSAARSAAAVERLERVTRRLRRECPWDREQDERSIVPHTVEEAYELADAAQRRDDGKLVDELGDVLFQVLFLSLLLEERCAGDIAAVADACRAKLIRRHPHVFGDVEVENAGEVLRNWDAIKRDEPGREPGLFGDLPDTLPAPLYASKVLRRARGARANGALDEPVAAELATRVAELDPGAERERCFEQVGDVLLAAVATARELDVDPELALRSAADRFKSGVEREGGNGE